MTALLYGRMTGYLQFISVPRFAMGQKKPIRLNMKMKCSSESQMMPQCAKIRV